MKKLREFLRLLREYARSQRRHKAEVDFKARELAFLLPHFKKSIPRYIGLFFLLLLSSGLSLPGPAITGHIIDHVFVSRDTAQLHLFVLLLLAILLVSEIVRIVQEYFLLRLSQEFTYSIRVRLLERILRYPLSFFKNYQTGYLVSRLDEVNLLGSFFSLTVLSLAENLIRFLGALFLISRYNLKLTVIAIFILPLFFGVAKRSMGVIRMTSINAMERNAKVRGKIQETLSGIEVVKTYAKEGKETAEIKTGLRNIIEMEILQNLFSSLSGRILGVVTGVNLLVILWVGGHEIMAGRLMVGQYVAFVAYIGYLYGPIQMFAVTFLQFQRAFMASKRISSFMGETAEDEGSDRTHEFKILRGDVKFENVRYHYGDGKDVLRDVSFSIRSGEKIAFVGKSGAGKSTLVHLILGLYEPIAGCIEVDGVDIRRVKLESLRNRIGIVSQNIFLFDDTILNNIKYSRPDALMEEVVAAAEAAGCHDFISRFPEGYNTGAGEVGKRLSGGEKQRISIARCLLKKPDLIIFDEPTAHLDSVAVKNLITSIRDLFREKTCLIISHHLNNINWVDRIYVLEEGRLVQVGTQKELEEKTGEYRDLFETDPAFSA
jgi:subfamily B ATP-binding cassette protein MsbA